MDEKMMLNFIPVTEQCPEEDGFVLAKLTDDSVLAAEYVADETGDRWYDENKNLIEYDSVAAWAEMPFDWRLPSPVNPYKVREELDKSNTIEDIEGEIDQMELSDEEASIIEKIPRDLLYERFEKALSNNDCYWEAYWQTIDGVIREEIRNEQEKRKKQ